MTFKQALRWAVLGGIFITPFIALIVAQNLFFPFITGKNFAFRFIVEVISFLWLALAIADVNYRPKRSWVLLSFGVFVLVIGIADLHGANPFKSIWSNYERMEGWVTLAHLFMFFVVTMSTLNTELLWRRFWQTSVGVSLIICAYSVAQFFHFIAIDQGSSRLDATLGNATYLAIYLQFHLFMLALFWAQDWQAKHRSWLRSGIYAAIMLFQSIILFFTATRGAILGAIGGAFLAALILVILARRSRVAWRAATGVAVALLIVIAGFFLVKNQAWVQRSEPLQRLASISADETTTIARFMNWGMAWKGIQEHPILGWGQEDYNLVFDKYYNPNMYAQEPWFDRVHQVLLDWFVAGGIIGLLAYLSLFGTALWALWRSRAFSIAERSILTGLLAGYLFYLMFTFDNITSYLLFVMVLGYIASRSTIATNAKSFFEKSVLPLDALPVAAAMLVVVCGAVVYFVNIPAYVANTNLIQALSQQADATKNLDYFKMAADAGTFGTQEAREHFSQAAVQIAQSNQSADVKKAYYDTALAEMQAQMKQSPLDARFPLFLGVVQDAFGQHNDAGQTLAHAVTLSPTKQSILFQYAFNQLGRGDTQGALANFKKAYDLAPEYTDARLYYAVALIRSGDEPAAEQILAPVANDPAVVSSPQLLSAYAATGQFAKLVSLAKAHADANPNDPQAQFGYAAALYQSGNKTAAVAQLKKIELAHPELASQIDPLIKQVQSGTAKVQ